MNPDFCILIKNPEIFCETFFQKKVIIPRPDYYNISRIIRKKNNMKEKPLLKIVRLRPDEDSDISIPRYMTPESAGMDLCAAVTEDTVINPGDILLVPTGFAMAIPSGYEGEIRPRSGLAVKFGITLINSPGTVDADYRDEVKVAIINLGREPFVLKRGDRIAQMLIKKVYQASVSEVQELSKTERTGGFGHTGI